ncbi:MAG: DNA repair exonuclease [Desulfobacteraceae bacterium]|jgi:DNA repair exonuclease SbcCD nuclease subunit
MPSFSFVHTADLHLDSPFSAFSLNNPDIASAMRSATMEAFDKVIQLCLEKHVDFLLVAGDVYDGADRSLRAQVKFRDGLRRLDEAGIRSFVVHGNHDPLNGWSSSLEWPKAVHIFRDQVQTVRVERDRALLACIQGISYPERDERRNLSLLLKRTDPAFHIGLLHANVGSDTGHEPYAPCTLEDLLKPEMDYWALGHVHQRRVLSQDLPWVVYPGNTQGRNIREGGEKGCYFVRVGEDREVEIEFHATDVLRWVKRDLSIQDLQTEQDLLVALDRLCQNISESESGRPTIARIFLTGRGPLYTFLRKPATAPELLEIVQEMGMSYNPYLWVEQVRLGIKPELDMAALIEGKDFVGELLRYARELSEGDSFEEQMIAELSPLFEDPRVRKFLDSPNSEELRELLGQAEAICAESLRGEGGE